MILTGLEAIAYARQHGVTLSKRADPLEAERDGLSPEEADRIAAEDPGLVYVLAVERRGGST